jgi:RNA polymerase sigma-70 factor (ECF subfamily)
LRTAHPEDDVGSSDARLIDGLRRKKPAAFAGLHERYAPGIYSLALRVVRHGPDAEDITQDVLLRAYERLPQDRDVILRPWLYRLTLNRCYDHLRMAARRPSPAAPGREAASPLDPYDQSELQQLLEATIDDLTRRQRAALLLKDVHGLSLVEVADCLGLTPGSVEVLLARSRKAFRARFKERCVAAGRPLPRSAGGLLALPLLPLPPALAPPAPVIAPPVFACGPPLALAAGGGIGAALGLQASIKTAALIAFAAVTLGTAEVAVTQSGDRPPRPSPSVALVAASAPAVAAPPAGASVRPSPRPSAKAVAASESPPSPSAAPLPAASPAVVAEPTPTATPLAISTPTATPTPVDTPTAHPTASAFPSPGPTASPLPEPSASATPSPSALP